MDVCRYGPVSGLGRINGMMLRRLHTRFIVASQAPTTVSFLTSHRRRHRRRGRSLRGRRRGWIMHDQNLVDE
jgi:hypothetical protein